VSFPLTAGSDFQASADTWASGGDYATSNQQNLLDSTSNNVSLAGVQLEIGSVDTDFAHEDFGTTLQKCQRYFIQHTSVAATGNDNSLVTARANTTTHCYGAFQHLGMRASPSITVSDATDFKVGIPGASVATTAVSLTWQSPDISTIVGAVSSGLTAGQAVDIKFDGGGVRTFALSAEL